MPEVTEIDPAVTLRKALVEAQREIKNPTKNAKNPFLKNHYADLGAVIDVVKEALLKQGVIVVQELHSLSAAPPMVNVVTHFMHEAGGELALQCAVPLKEFNPQGAMGAFTYGRRYGLLAAFNLAAEDDDGNTACGKSVDDDLEPKKTVNKEATKSAVDKILAGK